MRALFVLFLLAGVGVLVAVVVLDGAPGARDATGDGSPAAASQAARCQAPITYRVGAVDASFGISAAAVQRVLEEAAGAWQEAVERELFVYAPDGDLEVRLTYDDRQQTWEAQEEARRASDRAQERYERLAGELEKRERSYENQRAAAEQEARRLDRQIQELNRRVRQWNAGAITRTEEEARSLEEARRRIEREERRVDRQRGELEAMRQRLNRLVDRVNEAAEEARRRTASYNERFGELEGFNKGEHVREQRRWTIDVYQFDGEADLRRVLIHELGHALGIEHVESPSALMHPRLTEQNRSRNTLSAADRAALIVTCGA